MRLAVAAQVAVITSLATLVSTRTVSYLDQLALDPRTGPVVHALLVTVGLVLASWIAVRPRLLSATRAQLRVSAVSGLLVGYALTPTTRQGRTYAAQLVAAPGTASILLDLTLWLVVGTVATLVVSAPASRRAPASYARR